MFSQEINRLCTNTSHAAKKWLQQANDGEPENVSHALALIQIRTQTNSKLVANIWIRINEMEWEKAITGVYVRVSLLVCVNKIIENK